MRRDGDSERSERSERVAVTQLTAPAGLTPAHAVAFGILPNSPSQNRPPALPVNHIRCSAGHRPARRCDAGAQVRPSVGACLDRAHTRCAPRTPSYLYYRPVTGSSRQASGGAPYGSKKRQKGGAN